MLVWFSVRRGAIVVSVAVACAVSCGSVRRDAVLRVAIAGAVRRGAGRYCAMRGGAVTGTVAVAVCGASSFQIAR